MIISIDNNPKFSLYYIGGLILNILGSNEEMALEKVIKKVLDEFKGKLSVNYIYFSFDWLYLISAIEIKNNKVMLCK